MAAGKWIRLATATLLAITCLAARAGDLSFTVSEPDAPVTAGAEAGFWLNALNVSAVEARWLVPAEIKCRLSFAQDTIEVSAKLRDPSQAGGAAIAPGSFARREYTFPIPETARGELTVAPAELSAARLVLTVQASPPPATAEPQNKGMLYFLKGRRHSAEAGSYDPDEFFKQHIFGYEPFYFIAGTKSPNAKFQFSFKYRLLNDRGWLAREAPFLKGLHLAYSQTSLWDLNAPSAPFFDSSYRPELMYSWDRVLGGGPTNWFRLDLQGGLQHESNGRDGGNSRSMNIAYLRPRLIFGKDTGPQLTLIPRAWVYVGDVNDNPDIADYRGYADLRAVFGWKRGLQVSAMGRIGQDGDHAGGQFDATYPLMQQPSGSFSVYLHAQYFIGYGESLVGYKDKTDIIRVGFSLYR